MQCMPLARVAVGDIGHYQEHSILLANFAAIMISVADVATTRPARPCADYGEPMHGDGMRAGCASRSKRRARAAGSVHSY